MRIPLLLCVLVVLTPALALAGEEFSGFSVVGGGSATVTGFHGDVTEGARALSASTKGPLFLFQHRGVKYVVRDAGLIAEAEAAVAPGEALEEKQRALDEKQQALDEKQGSPAERAALAKQKASLGREQEQATARAEAALSALAARALAAGKATPL